MKQKKKSDVAVLLGYAGSHKGLTLLGLALSAVSMLLSMAPYICIWLAARDLIAVAPDWTKAQSVAQYGWLAFAFAVAGIILYFAGLMCTHLAAFRTASNIRKQGVAHVMKAPLGFFDSNASGLIRGRLDAAAADTETLLAHNLADIVGTITLFVAMLVMMLVFDWRMGAACLLAAVRELGVDVRSLPIHVVVLEALGRNAGWTTAAAALAREQEGDAPHLLYPPERPFHEDEFLDRVGDMYRKLGGVVVVASEGLHDDEGKPIVPPIFQTGRSTYFGDVSSHLAQLVVRRLGIKARSEKPGILARASIAWQSPVDAAEAEEAGRAACRAVLAGETGQMVAFRRVSSAPCRCETFLVPIEEVMLGERVLPAEYLTAGGTDVTEAFCGWCRPLLGPELPSMARLF